MPTERIEVPVLIVGAGPVGLMSALLLRRLGVNALLVERRDGPQRAPAAHCVNGRTFEICRQAGVDRKALDAASKSPADAGWTSWVTKLGGEVLGRLPYERQLDDVLAVTPTPLRNLSQHRFEPILLESLRASGAAAPEFRHVWESAQDDGAAVTSTLAEIDTGRRYEVRSRYLIAADGAGSRVRKSVAIPLIGPDVLQSFVMIHFEANLRPLVRDCPGVLYWVTDPDAAGVFVAHDIDREWVFMHAWDRQRESAGSYDAERCESIVRNAVAEPGLELTIRTISTWAMTCQVAERYRAGNVFLVGDAAHRFPPTGGLGLNTGVQDAHNLAWKLAAVLDGSAAPALLDTYESERRPIAQYNAEQSMQNAVRLLEIPQALGCNDDRAASRRNFDRGLADASWRRGVATAIDHQAEHFDMLGLQLGYSYERGAILPDGTEKPQVANPVRQFVPSSRPGARLPHGWLRRDATICSSLDLIPLDRLTLIAGPSGAAWIEAARELPTAIECLRVGVDVADPDGWWASVAAMPDDGALLVRPDQHVAFRSGAPSADPHAILRRAVAVALGRETQEPVTNPRSR